MALIFNDRLQPQDPTPALLSAFRDALRLPGSPRNSHGPAAALASTFASPPSRFDVARRAHAMLLRESAAHNVGRHVMRVDHFPSVCAAPSGHDASTTHGRTHHTVVFYFALSFSFQPQTRGVDAGVGVSMDTGVDAGVA